MAFGTVKLRYSEGLRDGQNQCVGNTVKPRFNESLYNKIVGISNDILRRIDSKIYKKEP